MDNSFELFAVGKMVNDELVIWGSRLFKIETEARIVLVNLREAGVHKVYPCSLTVHCAIEEK